MSVVNSVSGADIAFVAAQKKQPTQLAPSEALDFALNLFDFFGQRYAKGAIRPHVKNQEPFDRMHRALIEIQTRLASGKTTYVEISCPHTATVLQGYSEAQNLATMFQRVKHCSYALLPFPQKMILHYSEPELGTLTMLDMNRRRGLDAMIELLKWQDSDDKKEVALPKPKPFSPNDECALSRLYFRSGALIWDGRVIYFSEMVHMWGCIAHANAARVERLKNHLSIREWVDDKTVSVMPFLSFAPSDRADEWSYLRYLAYCSVLSIRRNLDLPFSTPVWKKLGDKCVDDESTRSDLCYFSAMPKLMYELDIGRFNRSSAHFVRIFQLFFFITRNVDIAQKEHEALLTLLFYMDQAYNPGNLPGFANRNWDQPSWSPEEIAAFKDAWKGLKEILSLVTKRNISLAELTPEDEALLAKPECWTTLCFLWKRPLRDDFVGLINGLSQLPHFSVTLEAVSKFFVLNADTNVQQRAPSFLEAYAATIAALGEKGIQIQHPELIFFNPPSEILIANAYVLAASRTKIFVDRMQPYPCQNEAHFCAMLFLYITYPQAYLFELLKDCEAIGIQSTEELVYDLLSKKQPEMNVELAIQEQTRAPARVLAKEIQDEYDLPPVQIFSIYMELIRLEMGGQLASMGAIKEAVHALAKVCPAISDETVWFMMRYRPANLTVERVTQLAEQAKAWIENDTERQRFVVNQEVYKKNAEEIEDFATIAMNAYPGDDHAGYHFSTTCQMDLLAAFFPVLQPLSNFFHLTHLTLAQGIRWGEPIWKTHEGQLILLKHSNVGTYLHWMVIKSRPVLFISFFNMKTGRAISSFIPLQVLTAVIEPVRKPFYGLLAQLSQQVLKEQAHGNVPEDAPETPASWAPAYVGVKETIAHNPDVADHVPRMWEFFRQVKLGYRNFYLHAISDAPLPQAPNAELWDIAAFGHIFPLDPRGSLVPELPDEHSEYYTPDATVDFVGECRDLFTKSTHKLELLHLNLKTIDGEIPVSYHSQTAEEFVGVAFNEDNLGVKNDKVAPPEQRVGRYITLMANGIKIPLRYPPKAFEDQALFQRYFDYHNLVLKAAYYFTRSLE